MSLYLQALPAAVGLVLAGLAVTIVSLLLLWRHHDVQRAGYLLGASVWLTAWGAIINLGYVPMLATTAFALSIAVAYILTTMHGVAPAPTGPKRQIRSEWFKQLADRIDDMLWLVSAETGTPLYVSPAYLRLTGKETIDLYKNPNAWREMVHPDDLETFVKRFSDSAEKSINYRIINAQGEPRWMQSHIWPHRDASGHVSAFAGITRDVTELYQQAPQGVTELQIQDQLGTLANGLANDFNSALFSIAGQASLAKAKLTESHPAHEHLERMIATSDGAKQIAQQMLAYAGNAPQEAHRLNLNLFVQDNRKTFKRHIPRNVLLQTSLTRFLPMVEADESQLMMVVQNLIANAVEAGAKKVLISTGTESVSAETPIGWRQFGDALPYGEYVTIAVKDDGCGIDSDAQQHMFEPYFTTKPEGIGLGLSTALGIVRAHDGAVRLQTESGNGATFQLLLPVCRNESVKVNSMNLVAESPRIAMASQVMIIDDEDTVTEVVADLLELEGIATITSNDGSSAVELYRRQQEQIGLVILDLTMPGMSGREVFEALRKINPDVNVLVSSGYGRKEVSRHIAPEALAGIIQKPFDVFTLVSEIRSHLY